MPHYMLVMRWKTGDGEEKIKQHELNAANHRAALETAHEYFTKHFHPYNGAEMPDTLTIVKIVDTCPIGKWYVDLQRAAKADLPEGPLLVVCQDWEESERSWGVLSVGFTLHSGSNECTCFVKDYVAKYNNKASAPDSYTRTSGKPRLVEVSEDTFLKVKHSGSIWGVGSKGPKAYMP